MDAAYIATACAFFALSRGLLSLFERLRRGS